jgi:hypothetical protein
MAQQKTRSPAHPRKTAGPMQTNASNQSEPKDLLDAVTPAFQEARRYIEGSPVRAAAVGAIAGGVLMTLFSTEKGRSFVKVAYDFVNPMVTNYARDYISEAAGGITDSALGQH